MFGFAVPELLRIRATGGGSSSDESSKSDAMHIADPAAAAAASTASAVSGAPPPTSPPAPRAVPVPPQARIDALDVVRGVALLGILLVNVHLFRRIPYNAWLRGEEVARTMADRVVEIVTGTLASGTFIGLFSLLFGIGIAMQLSRVQGSRFGTARILVLRRMAGLLAIGYAHRQFSSVDILMPYAVLGIGIVLLAGPFLPPRAAWARTLAAVGLVLVAAVGPIAANADALASHERLLRERAEFAQEALADGSVTERLEVRALEALGSQGGRVFMLQVMGWMLIGLWIGASGMLRRLGSAAGPLLLAGAGAVAAGALLRLGMALPLPDPGALRGPDGAGGFLGVVGSMLLVIGTGLTAAGLANRVRSRGRPYRRLAAIGRMALTAYILQTVLVRSVLLVPGAAAALGSAGSLLLVVAVWTLLLFLCPWWMARFRYGPVEWLWRSLTYLELQPFRARMAHPTA
jgi:uncharacterized protein